MRHLDRLAKTIGYTVLAWAAALALIELDWRLHTRANLSSRYDAPRRDP